MDLANKRVGRFSSDNSPFSPVLQEPPELQRPLRHYWRVIRRRSRAILVATLLGVGIVATICALCPEAYESTTLIDVDRQSSPEVLGEDRVLISNDADQFMATQMRLLDSDIVLRPVVEKYDLLEKEHQFRRFFFWRYSETKRQAIAAAPIELKKLKIDRPPNTYVISIAYRNSDPAFASGVANAIAESYLQNLFDSRVRDSNRLTSSMEQQLVDFKAKMEKSNDALMSFQRKLGVVDPEQKTSILVAQLQALNTEYANAQSARIQKEAAYKAARNGSLEGAQISTQADDLSKLTISLNEAKVRFAQVKSSFGPGHPEYRKAYAELQAQQANFEDTRKNITLRISADYKQAADRENMLEKAVNLTKSEVDDLTARSFDYARLKNEAQTAQKLYEDLFSKIEQSGINGELQNSVIRLADSARPAAKPVFPNWPIICCLSSVFFFMAGVAFYITKDVLDESAKDAELVRHVLGVDVLCSLPKMKRAALPAELRERNKTVHTGLQNRSDASVRTYQESIRLLGSAVVRPNAHRRVCSILISSALPAEGKSTVAAFLAISHAEQRKKTLLVDADFRRPVLHQMLGVTKSPGLSDFILGSSRINDLVIPVPGQPYLFLMPSGSDSLSAAALMGSRIKELVFELQREFDLVIFDSAPLLGFAESLEIACAVDSTILAAHAGQTTLRAMEQVIQLLRRLDVAIAGIVLNMVSAKDMSDAYSGTYARYYSAQNTP